MTDKQSFEDFVYIAALENAINFKGKANPKALIGKCMPNFPEMKKDMATHMQIINSICDKVNKLGEENQRKELENLNPKSLEKKKRKNLRKKTVCQNLK